MKYTGTLLTNYRVYKLKASEMESPTANAFLGENNIENTCSRHKVE